MSFITDGEERSVNYSVIGRLKFKLNKLAPITFPINDEVGEEDQVEWKE